MEKNDMTAVEWYYEQTVVLGMTNYAELLQQAKQMEKEQKENKWIEVQEQRPEPYVEVLVKTPTGLVQIASWRAAYLIFSCQVKGESTLGWKWKLID